MCDLVHDVETLFHMQFYEVSFIFQKSFPDAVRTVMNLSFWTNRSEQIVQTQIRQTAPQEQSDQGLFCLLFHLHLFDKITLGLASLFEL